MKNDNLKEQYRINERIRVREVRLVGDNIETGVYPIAQALKIAEEQGMDLVEISPNAAPPVCRVIDYQKFLYQQKKRQKEQKAKSVKVVVKEIRFGPQTDDHDYNFKLKHAKGFLEEGSKVKAYVFFKGRSILFKEQGEVLLLRFANDLEDYGKVEHIRPVGRHQIGPGRFGRDMADDVDASHLHHLLLHRQRHREEQFVVFAAVQGRHHGIGVQLLSQRIRLLGDRNPVQINPRPALRGLANL